MKKTLLSVALAAGCVLMAVCATWPAARFAGARLAGNNLPDEMLNHFVLKHNLEKAAKRDFDGFFDANIMYPYRDTLAFTDTQLTHAALALPLYLAGAGTVLCYNLLFIAAFALASCGGFLLGRRICGSLPAALCCGVAFGNCTFLHLQTGHIQVLLSTGFIPFAFLFCHRFIELRRMRDAAGLALSFVAVILASGQAGVLLSLFLAAVLLHGLLAERGLLRSRGFITGLCLAAFAAAALVAPQFLASRRVASTLGFKRTVDRNVRESVSAGQYFTTAPGNLSARTLGLTPTIEGRSYYLGIPALFLAACSIPGMFFRRERPRFRKDFWRGLPFLYLLLGAAAVVLAAGPYVTLFGREAPAPYLLLFKHYPGLGFTRVPGRAAVFAMSAVSVLAAAGLAAICRLFKGRIAGAVLTGAGCCLVFLDQFHAPLPVSGLPRGGTTPKVYKILDRLDDAVAVMEFPYRRLWDSAYYTHDASLHSKRVLNAWTGIQPPLHLNLYSEVDSFPSERALRVLRALGVNYVVCRLREIDATQRLQLAEGASAAAGVEKVYEDRDFALFRLSDANPSFLDLDRAIEGAVLEAPASAAPGELVSAAVRLKIPQGALFVNAVPYHGFELRIDEGGRATRAQAVSAWFPPVMDAERNSGLVSFRAPRVEGRHMMELARDGRNAGRAWIEVKTKAAVEPSYAGRLEVLEAPATVHENRFFKVGLRFTNSGAQTWAAESDVEHPYKRGMTLLHWKWLGGRGVAVSPGPLFNTTIDERLAVHALPRDLGSGESVEVTLPVQAPRKRGRFILRLEIEIHQVRKFTPSEVNPAEIDVEVL